MYQSDKQPADRAADACLKAVNARFNDELSRQIAGTLPPGHIYRLGHPSAILLSAGLPNLPIEMAASRLASKSVQANHPFDISDVYDLVLFINSPIAVFNFASLIEVRRRFGITRTSSALRSPCTNFPHGAQAKNIIVDIERGGKQYLIGVYFNQMRRDIIVSDIRGIFPKDNHEWLNWITQGKADYLHKEKIQTLIDQQRINPAEVAYLDLDSVTKILQNFENPKCGG
ncbi:MAG: hypothetical protein K2O53_02785 [Bacteroidales bacterium]|nr:hypothetical protein [Bacteroidales bacterium]